MATEIESSTVVTTGTVAGLLAAFSAGFVAVTNYLAKRRESKKEEDMAVNEGLREVNQKLNDRIDKVVAEAARDKAEMAKQIHELRNRLVEWMNRVNALKMYIAKAGIPDAPPYTPDDDSALFQSLPTTEGKSP